MQPCLVVLAAGVSSRYGRLKQLEPVGPGGETLLDYAIHDARQSGFGRVLLVIRPEIEAALRTRDEARHHRPPVDYVLQRVDALPPGTRPPARRGRPWGTGQAVLSIEGRVAAPFVVINADDFYGRSSFAQLHDYLTAQTDRASTRFALVGFRLEDTLSRHGGVSRGLCRCNAAGDLIGLRELTEIRRHDSAITGQAGRDTVVLGGDALVSMNIWGLTPAVFPLLRTRFADFLTARGDDPVAEFLLPEAIGDMVAGRAATVRVLRGRETWFGITHPDDRDRARARLRTLVATGAYPERLFDA